MDFKISSDRSLTNWIHFFLQAWLGIKFGYHATVSPAAYSSQNETKGCLAHVNLLAMLQACIRSVSIGVLCIGFSLFDCTVIGTKMKGMFFCSVPISVHSHSEQGTKPYGNSCYSCMQATILPETVTAVVTVKTKTSFCPLLALLNIALYWCINRSSMQ